MIVCVCVVESRWRLTLGQEENGCGGCAYIIQLKVLSGVSLSLSLCPNPPAYRHVFSMVSWIFVISLRTYSSKLCTQTPKRMKGSVFLVFLGGKKDGRRGMTSASAAELTEGSLCWAKITGWVATARSPFCAPGGKALGGVLAFPA